MHWYGGKNHRFSHIYTSSQWESIVKGTLLTVLLFSKAHLPLMPSIPTCECKSRVQDIQRSPNGLNNTVRESQAIYYILQRTLQQRVNQTVSPESSIFKSFSHASHHEKHLAHSPFLSCHRCSATVLLQHEAIFISWFRSEHSCTPHCFPPCFQSGKGILQFHPVLPHWTVRITDKQLNKTD